MAKPTEDQAKDFLAIAEVLIGVMLAEPGKWVPIVSDSIHNLSVWPHRYRGAAKAIYDLHSEGRQVMAESVALMCDLASDELAAIMTGVSIAEYAEETISSYILHIIALGKMFAQADVGKRLMAGEIGRTEAAEELLDLEAVGAVARRVDSEATAARLDEIVANPAKPGALTGIEAYDDLIAGMGPKETTSFAAIYGGRKTSVIRNLALAAAARGSRVVIYLAEGDTDLYVAFCVSMIANQIIMLEGNWDHPQNKRPLNGYTITRTDWWKRRPIQKSAYDRANAIWRQLGIDVLDQEDSADDAETILAQTVRRKRESILLCAIDYIQNVNVYEDHGKYRQIVTNPFLASIKHKLLLHKMKNKNAHIMIAAQKPESAFNEEARKSPSAQIKGGGELPQELDVAFDVNYTRDEPTEVSLVTKKNRKGPFGEIYFELEKESGLLLAEKRMTADGPIRTPIEIIPNEMLSSAAATTQEEMIL